MPIRLNLLAEAQAVEELRRRDPVKRALWVSALLVCLMLVWSSSLQLKAIMANGEVSRIQSQMNAQTNEFKLVQDNEKKAQGYREKLDALRRLGQQRFLYGSLLNALQHTALDDVQLNRLRTDQSYLLTEGTKAKTNDNRVIPGKPSTITEKIVVTLDASDSSSSPGDQISTFKSSVSTNAYFKDFLGKTNLIGLKSVSPMELMAAPGSTIGRACVLFQLEARAPEVTR